MLRQLRALLPQFVDTATATQYGPREALRSAQLAAGQQCGVLGAHRSPQIPLQPMGGCQHLCIYAAAIDQAMLWYWLYSGSLNQCPLLFYTSYKGETLRVRSHTVKSTCINVYGNGNVGRLAAGGGHLDIGFINQALSAKVSPLDFR